MQLRDGVWLEGAYYIDFDEREQLRVVGPKNHLHFASVGFYRSDIQNIEVLPALNGNAAVRLELNVKSFFLHDPAMGHIRKVRQYTEFINQLPPLFSDVLKKHPTVLEPNYIQSTNNEITYRRLYGSQWYGVRIELPQSVQVKRHDKKRGFQLEGTKPIVLTILTEADNPTPPALQHVIADLNATTPELERLWRQAGLEVEHLVAYRKTSGYAYGTVFPRDWMESADLGLGDLTPEAWRFMYQESLVNVSNEGIGWHENMVGEYHFEEHDQLGQTERSLDELVAEAEAVKNRIKSWMDQLKQLYITRNMIDIEPRYLVGLAAGGFEGVDDKTLRRLRQIAQYIMHQATDNALMTFKKVPEVFRRHRLDKEYCHDGNWRDSENGHLHIHPVIAPYDVNVVFYPQALQVMYDHAKLLQLDKEDIKQLIQKWSRVKDWYRFTNPDGSGAFALALYDVKEQNGQLEYKKMEVNQTDEAYELFYGNPLEKDVVSFCQRLLNPEYFYTDSGPTIVGRHDGFTSAQYHGAVTWTKQTAYVVAGLDRQLGLASRKGWSADTAELIRRAIIETAEASIRAFRTFQAFPELYFDDHGIPKFYSDQPNPEGIMNTVQLWSAVGARRIIKAYLKVTAHG
jgi:hypothetical protein